MLSYAVYLKGILEFGGVRAWDPQNGQCSARGVSVWERVGNVAGEVGAVVGHAF